MKSPRGVDRRCQADREPARGHHSSDKRGDDRYAGDDEMGQNRGQSYRPPVETDGPKDRGVVVDSGDRSAERLADDDKSGEGDGRGQEKERRSLHIDGGINAALDGVEVGDRRARCHQVVHVRA
jgi:hypothetical protein